VGTAPKSNRKIKTKYHKVGTAAKSNRKIKTKHHKVGTAAQSTLISKFGVRVGV
jgi:hypothetical protein